MQMMAECTSKKASRFVVKMNSKIDVHVTPVVKFASPIWHTKSTQITQNTHFFCRM